MKKRHKRVSASLPSTALALGRGVASRTGNSDQPGALWPLAWKAKDEKTVILLSEPSTHRADPMEGPAGDVGPWGRGAHPPAGFGTVGLFKGGTGMLR